MICISLSEQTCSRHRCRLSQVAYSLLSEALPAEVPEELDVSWEEHTMVGVTHLLQTILAKNGKESTIQLPQLEMMDSTDKLKKNISKVLKKIFGGALTDQ